MRSFSPFVDRSALTVGHTASEKAHDGKEAIVYSISHIRQRNVLCTTGAEISYCAEHPRCAEKSEA